MTINDKLLPELEGFGTWLKSLGVAPGAIETIVGSFDRTARAMQAEHAGAKQALENAITEKWGADKDRNLAIAKQTVRALGLLPDDGRAIEQMLGKDGSWKFVETMHHIGTKLPTATLPAPATKGEDNMSTTTKTPPATSVAALKEKLMRWQADDTNMRRFLDQRDPLHAATVAERQDLLTQLATATEAADAAKKTDQVWHVESAREAFNRDDEARKALVDRFHPKHKATQERLREIIGEEVAARAKGPRDITAGMAALRQYDGTAETAAVLRDPNHPRYGEVSATRGRLADDATRE